MGKLKVKSGKGEIVLTKSKSLVGLKTSTSENIEQKDFVEKELHKNLGGFNVVTLKGNDIDQGLDEVRQKDEVEVGTHIYFAEGSQKPLVATGEIFIQFEEGVSKDEQGIVLEEFSLVLEERRSVSLIIAKVTPQSPNPLKVAAALQEISMVKSAEPDLDTILDEYFNAPDDDLLDHQWHLKNTGQIPDTSYRTKKGADAKVVDAWKRLGSPGRADVTIAVIDNGFDLTHPDLKDKVFRPFDIWNQSNKLNQGDTRFAHGTPCASVALASSNGRGIVGAAPNARFMPISGTSFSLRATEQMFAYCVENGADIISCSWGTTDANFNLSPLKEEAIAKAAKEGRKGKGCIILYAAGNENIDYLNFYASHPDVIAVGATTSQDEHANYSNRGQGLSVVAPSNGAWPITAARAWWDEGLSWETGNYKFWRDGRSRGSHYKHFGGTSSSTPLVAGICALILSANPNLTAKQVKSILEQTADKIGRPSEYDKNGWSSKYGYGRVNADKAVAEALRRRDQSNAPVVEVSENVKSGHGLFEFNVKRQASEGWGVQIGAFAEYGNVLIQAEKLQKQFNEKIIVNINELNGKTVYKVVVGAFENKTEAVHLFRRMEAAGVRGFPRNLADLG